MAAKDEATNGLLVRGPYGDARQNPLVKIARNAASDMVGYANQFGMGPAARAWISVGVGLQVEYFKARLTQALGILPNAGGALLEGDDTGVGFTAGVFSGAGSRSLRTRNLPCYR